MNINEIVECLPQVVAVYLDVSLLVAWSALEQHWEDGVRYRLVVSVYHFLDYSQLVPDFVPSVLSYLVLGERNDKSKVNSLVEDELVYEYIHQVD